MNILWRTWYSDHECSCEHGILVMSARTSISTWHSLHIIKAIKLTLILAMSNGTVVMEGFRIYNVLKLIFRIFNDALKLRFGICVDKTWIK